MTQPLFPSQEGLEWLRVAARDIRLAELALGDSPPLAAEKALKGRATDFTIPLGRAGKRLWSPGEPFSSRSFAALR